MKIRKKQKNKAFTLIEALIAIAILMISIAAPLSLAAKGIEAANLAKQQITAYYLAQDAYE
jgi:type II secretory pathway pseudopilin PulG